MIRALLLVLCAGCGLTPTAAEVAPPVRLCGGAWDTLTVVVDSTPYLEEVMPCR